MSETAVAYDVAELPETDLDYQQFVESKRKLAPVAGIEVPESHMNPMLFAFQRDLTRWALRKGRSALFCDCGLGKTPMQLEWASHIPGRVLIVAPLSVSHQSVSEAAKFGWEGMVEYARSQDEANRSLAQVTITNYEMVERFDPSQFTGVVLDESSILKAIDGKTKERLIQMFAQTPYRLCCTATPAPNDIGEYANHAEFLGLCSREEMLAMFFVHDDQGWRLKGHAREPFYRWLASWGMTLSKPSDLGYSDDGYTLPQLEILSEFVHTDYVPQGMLFAVDLKGVSHRAEVRKSTLDERVERAIALINNDAESEKGRQWIAWCGLNSESKAITAAIGDDAVEVEGAMSPEEKTAGIVVFLKGEKRVLVTKSKVAGFGMNFQNASRQVFVGLSDSYEAYYQCIRRSWRFGQTQDVKAHVVLSDLEHVIYDNVLRKEHDAKDSQRALIANAAEYERAELQSISSREEYMTDDVVEPDAHMMLGDCVERIREVETESVGFSVFSPPFASLYTYSASDRDMGNCLDSAEFMRHFAFLITELLRVTKPGRLVAVHCAQISSTLATHGVIGIMDFRGDLIRAFQGGGFVYHGEVCIDKDPQAQAIRTHSKALLFVQKEKDRAWLRPALADYILVFRKPGENVEPIRGDHITNDQWIEWARPIWYGIDETDTLNVRPARSNEDERHICPLQLGTIERCVRLWSNPDDLVLSPFMGIGSEGVTALRHGRRFVGIELKKQYFDVAVRNITGARLQGRLELGAFS